MFMRSLLVCCCLFTAFFTPAVSSPADEPGWIELSGAKGLEAWKAPTGEWFRADSVGLDPDNPKRLAGKPGKMGILVNGKAGKTPDLVTKQSFGDIEVHVEFMVAKGSNSGVKLEGLYEIQIYDSYGKKEPTAS